ncbi:MAG TPA: phenylalanine--tRNA ligase subunit beta [Arenimonas sp.]|nr:phenylalanine--tRNA ligase subunit beta [Arenimonas sp.]HPO24552.1 phenylalanine--tRNA ligase subunit beta [Arenimonas sp.]HPW31827.1 phenylalanine--tRNA ligase subunit beta [Arenimonas sp.]
MKFPESWLREHVKVDATREELSTRLTAIGLEVEALEEIGGVLNGVVVAEILSAEKHPEADRLQVCSVNLGAGAPVQIVCGAPNARVGLKAPLATVGAVLPGGLEIKPAKLRGVESFGMLCSAKELMIDPDASGLLELPADAPVGASLSHYLGLPDASFELKLTPNRADCFSVRGVAFDVAAAFGAQVEALQIPEAKIACSEKMTVQLQAGADCPRFCGRIIDGLNIAAKSPLWLTEKLKRAGLRPISPLVDITNFIMLELGQPMHAYDAAKLSGPVGVRHAKAGEQCKLLDEREAELDPGFLVITDADHVVGLAGVMGGFDTRVTESTTKVFLEAAHFAPSAIIGRSRKLGMHTDASHRFERGVDPAMPRIAVERATELVLQILGGNAGEITEIELTEHLPKPTPVLLRRLRLQRVLGITIEDAKVEQIFRALGMQVHADDQGWQVTPPTRRFDIEIEEDLIEEIARIHGYENIPVTLPSGQISLVSPSETKVDEASVRRQLAARDYIENINYAFVDETLLTNWSLQANSVPLANPLTSELGVMRTSLLPGLVEALRRNLARQQNRIRLFELGRVFHKAAQKDAAPIETRRIAGVICGNANAEQWGIRNAEADFYDLKADVESLLKLSNLSAEFVASDAVFSHPGRSANIMLHGNKIGWLGYLHPRLVKTCDIGTEVLGFELDFSAVTERAIPVASELSRFPSVRRDIALVVPESTPWAALEASLKHALGPLLRDVLLFDRYVGTGLEPGSKSLAMGLILQDVSRTLTDSESESAVQKALAALDRDCGAKLRG